MEFELNSDYTPQGDQPTAIAKLSESIDAGERFQTLLGVTGSGKTFTVANVIEKVQKPTLVIAHNKTLAAQLYSELKSFFPNNAVEYFVSYYDFYQPEAYIPQSDTFIEKDASINDEIERLRIAATSALVTRKDVIVVASVSCIYGLGDPEDFVELMIEVKVGEELGRDILLERMVASLYERNDIEFKRGTFRVRGDIVDVFPAYMEQAIRIEFWGDEVESIRALDPLTGNLSDNYEQFYLYPATQYATSKDKINKAMERIRPELEERIAYFEKHDKLLEAQRIRMRTEYDLEFMKELGFCKGIENYSLHLSSRKPGDRPSCLMDFFPGDFLTVIDESHATVPQIKAMYNGDRARKEKLVDFGFRLPCALDNRPLQFHEFWDVAKQTLFVSATPAPFELEHSKQIAHQIIRPTGLLDPIMEVRPLKGQVDDFIGEIHETIKAKGRVLCTVLTKRMAEEMADFLSDQDVKAQYLHSDMDAVERVEVLRELRAGDFDVLVGVNLLREGLDLPEVALVGILDADKEGFLRSQTSIIQTAGRAARHEDGRVLLYADKMTDSISNAIEICSERRKRQDAYNKEHGLIPKSVSRSVQKSLGDKKASKTIDPVSLIDAHGDSNVASVIAQLESEMLQAADNLNFEKAAVIRDQINALKNKKK